MHSFCQPSFIVHTYMYYMHNALPFESLGFHKPSVSETLVLCSQTKGWDGGGQAVNMRGAHGGSVT